MRTSYILAVARIVYTSRYIGGCPDQVRQHILEHLAASATDARPVTRHGPIATGATGSGTIHTNT